MKKALNLTAILLSILMMAVSCKTTTPEQERLKECIEAEAKQYPISIAEGISLDDVTYKDNVVTYHATINNPLLPMDVIAEHQDVIKKSLLQSLHVSDNKDVSNSLDLCKAAHASIDFVISNGTESLTIHLPASEL